MRAHFLLFSSIGVSLLIPPSLAQGAYQNVGNDFYLIPTPTRLMSAPQPAPVPSTTTQAPIAPVLMPTSTVPNGPYYRGSSTYSGQVFPGQIFAGQVFPGVNYAGLTGLYLSKPVVKPDAARKDANARSQAMAVTANVVDGYGDTADGATSFPGPLGMSDIHIIRNNRFAAHRNRWMIYEDGNGALGGALGSGE